MPAEPAGFYCLFDQIKGYLCLTSILTKRFASRSIKDGKKSCIQPLIIKK